jgi:alpha-methylacyl-CoA racemase
MVLADLGAQVLRIDRPSRTGVASMAGIDVLGRGKRSAVIDLKQPGGAAVVLRLVRRADVLIEGFRPGVTERLGIGPEQCHAVNPGLVYGRMTGWGQDGPLAGTAGHDLTYLALSGVLHAIGPAGHPPVPPLHGAGDFGGGAMLLVVGILAALWRSRAAGASGAVVDAAIVDGAALLATQVYGLLQSGQWCDQRGANVLDGAAPNYGVYATADGRYLAVGPLERAFWAQFVELLGEDPGDPYDHQAWPEVRARIAARIATRTRDAWLSVFDGSDACVAPVLSLREAAGNHHPHLAARGTFVTAQGVPQPAPAPRFDGARPSVTTAPPEVGEHTRAALADWGVDGVPQLLESGVIWQRPADAG